MLKKRNVRWVAGLLACIMLLTVSGCGKSEETASKKDVPTSVSYPAVFTQHVPYEEFANRIVGSWSIAALEDYFWCDNRLVLYGNDDSDQSNTTIPYIDQTTKERYILIKEMFAANRGIHTYQAYYGTFSIKDDTTVTLNVPEYSINYMYTGDNTPGFLKNEAIPNGMLTGEEASAGFQYSYWHNATTTDPEDIQVNLADGTFDIASRFSNQDE